MKDRDCWRALATRCELFAEVLPHHHSGEDQWLWPWLMERAKPNDRLTLEAMQAEHAEIDPSLEACNAGFARLADSGDADARAELAVQLVATNELLGAHLAHEETDAIALMQSVMTQADWEKIDVHFREVLTPRLLVRLVPWALHQVPTAVRERIFSQPGGRIHRVAWQLTRGGFARRERQAFRYLHG